MVLQLPEKEGDRARKLPYPYRVPSLSMDLREKILRRGSSQLAACRHGDMLEVPRTLDTGQEVGRWVLGSLGWQWEHFGWYWTSVPMEVVICQCQGQPGESTGRDSSHEAGRKGLDVQTQATPYHLLPRAESGPWSILFPGMGVTLGFNSDISWRAVQCTQWEWNDTKLYLYCMDIIKARYEINIQI